MHLSKQWVPLCFLVWTQGAFAAAEPVFSDTGPDATAYGAPEYPVGRRAAQQPQKDMVGTYSHYDQIYHFHRVAKAATPSRLRRAPQELALNYRFRGATYSLSDYLA